LRVLREHLAINRASTEDVPNGVAEDRIGHTNDIEVNVWSIELGELARIDFPVPSRAIFSDHDVASHLLQRPRQLTEIDFCAAAIKSASSGVASVAVMVGSL
jgi:hypothetical protein